MPQILTAPSGDQGLAGPGYGEMLSFLAQLVGIARGLLGLLRARSLPWIRLSSLFGAGFHASRRLSHRFDASVACIHASLHARSIHAPHAWSSRSCSERNSPSLRAIGKLRTRDSSGPCVVVGRHSWSTSGSKKAVPAPKTRWISAIRGPVRHRDLVQASACTH